MNTHSSIKLLTLCSLMFLATGNGVLSASSQDALRDRMLARKADILGLLTAGKVGENFFGLLEARTPLTPLEKGLLEAENRDRKEVYTAIAEKNETAVEAVGALRAKTIHQQAPRGAWIQKQKNKWEKKP